MEGVMTEVETSFRARGLSVFTTMEDGSSLDATLMRKGLPEIIDAKTDLSVPWYQVAQRISRSEEGMMRWEVVASDETGCRQAVAAIREITDPYVARGAARYE
jgi:phosphomannomutase